MMQNSLNKEASELLCDAIQTRIQDGDAPQDEWFDSKGSAIPPNCFCIDADTEEQPHDLDGPCMGIQINIWEWAKKRRHLVHYFSGGGGSFYGGTMPSTTCSFSTVTLENWEITPFSQSYSIS